MNYSAIMLMTLVFPTLTPNMLMEDNPPEEKCANFSGKWKGECTASEGQKVEMSDFDLEQSGCRSIRVGDYLTIGGTTELSTTDKDSTLQQTVQLDWNADRTQLLGDFLVTGRYFNAPHIKSFQGRNVATLKLEGEKTLLLDMKVSFSPSHTLPDEKASQIACKLERQ